MIQSKILDKGKSNTFPRLMKLKNNELVVLMSDKDSFKNGTGVVIHDPDDIHGVGYFSSDWSITCFEPFNKEIILSNE